MTRESGEPCSAAAAEVKDRVTEADARYARKLRNYGLVHPLHPRQLDQIFSHRSH